MGSKIARIYLIMNGQEDSEFVSDIFWLGYICHTQRNVDSVKRTTRLKADLRWNEILAKAESRRH